MLYVFAVPPPGFHSTNTPASTACSAEFGFVQENVQPSHDFPTIEDFSRHVKTVGTLKQLAIFLSVIATAGAGTWWLNRPRMARVMSQ